MFQYSRIALLLVLLLGTVSFSGTAFSNASEESTVQLYEDDKPIHLALSPIIRSEVYLPVRDVFTYIGYGVNWSKENIEIYPLDEPEAGLYSTTEWTGNSDGDIQFLVKNNRLYINMNLFNTLTQWKAQWNQDEQTVTLHRTRLVEALSDADRTNVGIEAKEVSYPTYYYDANIHQYAPNDYLFFSSGDDEITFRFSSPLFTYAEYEELISLSSVFTASSRQPVEAVIEVTKEENTVSLQMHDAPREDLIVRLETEGLSKEFTIHYAEPFTYEITSSTDPTVPFYFRYSDAMYNVLPGTDQNLSIDFSYPVNRATVETIIKTQLGKNPFYIEWVSDKSLHLRVKADESYLIDLSELKYKERSISNWWNYLFTNVTDVTNQYSAYNSKTGKTNTLFKSMTVYEGLQPSPDGSYYLGSQNLYVSEHPELLTTLVDTKGKAMELRYSDYSWLPDSPSSLLYVDFDDRLHIHNLKKQSDTVIWEQHQEQQYYSLYLTNPYTNQVIFEVIEDARAIRYEAVDLSNETAGERKELPLNLFKNDQATGSSSRTVEFVDKNTLFLQDSSSWDYGTGRAYIFDMTTGIQTELELQQNSRVSVAGYGWLLIDQELVNVHTNQRIKPNGANDAEIDQARALSPNAAWIEPLSSEVFILNLKDGSRTPVSLPDDAEWIGSSPDQFYYRFYN